MESLSERTSTGYQQIHDGIIHLVDSARTETVRSVNALMTATYWEIGRRIVEFEQGGEARAAYGAQLIKRLSKDLSLRYKRGFSAKNLRQMRLFYLFFQHVERFGRRCLPNWEAVWYFHSFCIASPIFGLYIHANKRRKVAMIYIEQLELIHKSGDVLYPVKITRKSSGKTAFHLVPFGLNKTHDLLEVEDASEAIRLVIDERHSIRCSTLTATITNKKGKRIKRTGIYSIKGVNIKEYNVR